VPRIVASQECHSGLRPERLYEHHSIRIVEGHASGRPSLLHLLVEVLAQAPFFVLGRETALRATAMDAHVEAPAREGARVPGHVLFSLGLELLGRRERECLVAGNHVRKEGVLVRLSGHFLVECLENGMGIVGLHDEHVEETRPGHGSEAELAQEPERTAHLAAKGDDDIP
jgi:hypothetical protein